MTSWPQLVSWQQIPITRRIANIAKTHIPLVEQIRDEVDRLVEVELAEIVELPHLAAHLDEDVHDRRRRPEHDLWRSRETTVNVTLSGKREHDKTYSSIRPEVAGVVALALAPHLANGAPYRNVIELIVSHQLPVRAEIEFLAHLQHGISLNGELLGQPSK